MEFLKSKDVSVIITKDKEEEGESGVNKDESVKNDKPVDHVS
jgi:hypothetical protein